MWDQQDASCDEGDQDPSRIEATEVLAAMCDRLVEQIAKRRAEWAREHERDPKESGTRDTGPQPKQVHDDESTGEDFRANLIAEPKVDTTLGIREAT